MVVKTPLTGPDDPRHGTPNGYNNHDCRCVTCREAWRLKTQSRRQQRYERIANGLGVPPGVQHGDSTYQNWGCRCGICTAAHHAARATRNGSQ